MNEDTLLHLAHLARLSIPEEERAHLVKDIENIVGFVDTVQKVDISDKKEQASDRVNVFREDAISRLEPVHDLVEAAPLHKEHYVEVPKVLE